LPVRGSLQEKQLEVRTPALLGIVADTHVPSRGKRWATEPVIRFFQRTRPDLILHAGDAGHTSILNELQEIAPTIAVRGNADPLDLIEALPDQWWVTIGRRTILLIHGDRGRTAVATARAAAGEGIDLVVFGHSHQPLIEVAGSTILFNPGSPTERRWNPHFGLGLIMVSDAEIEPELILFEDPRHLDRVSP
jgi:putative phosphoesterase